MTRLIKILETGTIDKNGGIIADDALQIDNDIPLTIDFRPDTEWGRAKLKHIVNGIYAEIEHVPDHFKGLYLAPAYIRLSEPEIIDGVITETNVRFTEFSLTDKPSMGFMEPL